MPPPASRLAILSLILAILILGGCGRYAMLTPEEKPISPMPINTPDVTSQGRITLALAGDVMLARFVNTTIHTRGPRYPWGDVQPLLQRADLSLANLECVIAEGGEPFTPTRVFHFRADPEAVEALTQAGIDYVTLSNNHTMDFRAPALLETIGHLDEHGITHAGAGPNMEGAARYALLEAKGIQVGVVAFADHFEEYGATESEAGTNYVPVTLDERHFSRIRESIETVRAAGADLVVFSIHWGPNLNHVPSQGFEDFAHAVIEAGADIFHGHSAHVFQGIEVYKGKPIFYDTGDLINDYYVDAQHKNDQQLLFLVHATLDGVESVELIPLLISDIQVNVATGPAFDEILERIYDLSTVMGTTIRQKGDRLVVDLQTSR